MRTKSINLFEFLKPFLWHGSPWPSIGLLRAKRKKVKAIDKVVLHRSPGWRSRHSTPLCLSGQQGSAGKGLPRIPFVSDAVMGTQRMLMEPPGSLLCFSAGTSTFTGNSRHSPMKLPLSGSIFYSDDSFLKLASMGTLKVSPDDVYGQYLGLFPLVNDPEC